MKLKNSLEGLKGKFEQSEERMSKLEGRKTEIIVWRTERKKKKNEQSKELVGHH